MFAVTVKGEEPSGRVARSELDGKVTALNRIQNDGIGALIAALSSSPKVFSDPRGSIGGPVFQIVQIDGRNPEIVRSLVRRADLSSGDSAQQLSGPFRYDVNRRRHWWSIPTATQHLSDDEHVWGRFSGCPRDRGPVCPRSRTGMHAKPAKQAVANENSETPKCEPPTGT